MLEGSYIIDIVGQDWKGESMDIFRVADEWVKNDFGFALATIIESKGSTPRHNAKMLIREDKVLFGTIGGGPGEFKAIDDALKALSNGRNTIEEYIFNKSVEGGLATQCGGTMKVLIEVFPKKRRIVLIGGGHVNQAVLDLSDKMQWRSLVADDRPEYATPDLLPKAGEIFTADKIAEAVKLSQIKSSDICVIATKDCDLAALRETIKYSPAYIGMIGSKRKVKKIFETLQSEGVEQSLLDKVHAPIGLDIGAETPFEIAISIMSEIIAFISGTKGRSMKDWERL